MAHIGSIGVAGSGCALAIIFSAVVIVAVVWWLMS